MRERGYTEAMFYRILLTVVVVAGVMILSGSVAQAAGIYYFGGRIASVLLPLPLGPCPSAAIVVIGQRPGTFMIPPVWSFLFHQWFRPGPQVLGVATSPICGVIIGVGTSFF